MESKSGSTELADQVKSWLEAQGHPLEFRVNAEFAAAGVATDQGFYVQDSSSSAPREIDVLARVRRSDDDFIAEVSLVVECKWSRDKPWIVFTSPTNVMSPAACIAQTLGSASGAAVMHCLASNPAIQQFKTFASGARNGFGGRRAFTRDDGPDMFYNTVQSVVSKTISFAKRSDRQREFGKMPRLSCIAFPSIVVDGELFEAYFDSETNNLRVRATDHTRLHWRGAENLTPWISTVDIVRLDGLASYISHRKPEWARMTEEAQLVLQRLKQCVAQNSLAPLRLRPAARGYVGARGLLSELFQIYGEPPGPEG
jgi:hypothetical protein